MKSLFAKQKSKANLQRNAFDLSYSNKFTASPGMLLPCYVQEVNPNEHFVISPQSFLRTMPLNTASFVRAKQNIEFYFVPYRLLCRQFPQFVVGTEYKLSSITELNSYKDNLPTFDLNATVQNLINLYKSGDNNLDICGMPIWRGAVRLLDLLGYGVNLPTLRYFSKDGIALFDRSLDVNPFRLLAYQKIYFDFYRNPLYELNNPNAYNVDSVYGTTMDDPDFSDYSSPSNGPFALRYRNWKKDYFNCVSPYFQGADWLSSATTSPQFGKDVSTSVLYPSTGGYISSGNAQAYMYGNISKTPITSSFSISNLRSAFALDKLYRLSIAAGDGDYGSQIRAHYGFDVPYDNCKSSFLGGISEPISISEVITTATTSEAPTGDIYGKGLSANSGQKIVFDSKEHGIIMGIFSVVPEADYNACGVDRFNTKVSREDYYQPEFADLGLSPLSLFEYSYCAPTGNNSNQSMGYIPRYAEYKTRVDLVHGEFESFTETSNASQGTLSSWVAPRQSQLSSNYQPEFADLGLSPLSLFEYSYCAPTGNNSNQSMGYIPRYAEYKTRVDLVHGEFESFTETSNASQGTLSSWVAPRQSQLSSNFQASNAFLKIRPNIWNNISSVAFKGNEEEDIFIVDFRANVQAVRPMSVSGLPSI